MLEIIIGEIPSEVSDPAALIYYETSNATYYGTTGKECVRLSSACQSSLWYFQGNTLSIWRFGALPSLFERGRAGSGSYLLRFALAEHSTGSQYLVRSGLWQSIFYWYFAIMKYSNVLFPFQLTAVMVLMSLTVTVEGAEPPLEAAKVISISTAGQARSSHTAGGWFDVRHGSGGDFWSEVWNTVNTWPTESAKITTEVLLDSSELPPLNSLLTHISPKVLSEYARGVIRATASLSLYR